MGSVDVQAVLKAWGLVEAMAPGEVSGKKAEYKKDYFKNNESRKRTRKIEHYEKPWVNHQLKNQNEHKIQFRYYMGCYTHYKLVEVLRDIFKNEDEIINKDLKSLFSFTFLVDNNGNYIENSMFVPFLMYALKTMKRNSNIQYKELTTPYRDLIQLFEEDAQNIFLNGVTKDSLNLIHDAYLKYFYILEDNSLTYLEIEIKKIESAFSSKNFNSFYLEDIKQILAKGENDTLRRFINGSSSNERLDINENRSYIEETIQPINLPDGRWPSPVKHRLSLMQQISVNQILNNNEKISSVNGPPGTGKTTLLKDIFANIIVQRAQAMTLLDQPTKAFTKIKTIQLEGYNYPIYALDPKLSKYSMVVTSSNNGAVENISKDLPKLDEVIRSSNNDFDRVYATEAKELSMFPLTAKELLGNNYETWGLFSAALGKNENINTYGSTLFRTNDQECFIAKLEEESTNVSIQDWEDAINEFKNIYNTIQQEKNKLQKVYEEFNEIKEYNRQLKIVTEEFTKNKAKHANALEKKKHLEHQKMLTEQQIHNSPNIPLIKKLLGFKNVKKIELKKELNDIISQLKSEEETLYLMGKKTNNSNKQIIELKMKIKIFNDQLNQYQKQGLVISDDQYWSNTPEAYKNRQLNTPWITDELNFKRGQLFLKAMKIHKLILCFNYAAIKSTVRLIKFRSQLNLNDKEHKEYLKNMWQTAHLITPLISTTFASFSSMYKGIEHDFIDFLFIDEAGQASPQQSAGAIWRSKKVIAVGDPVQIEPVITIDQTILSDIRKYYKVNDTFIGKGVSVQNLADAANPYGTFNSYGDWIGIPLWVHRRCKNPMFSIANIIAYDNKMVLSNNGEGKGVWFDCKGATSNRQFVKEQGDLVSDKIAELWRKTDSPPNAYVISPFTEVKNEIKKLLRNRLLAMNISKIEVESWLRKSVGTVHTFQGKEANIVFFVTGTDESTDGAANWSCSKPNLINVAVTRAKEEFYIIGDHERLSKKPYYANISNNVELIDVNKFAIKN